MKRLLLLSFLLTIASSSYAITLDEINSVREPAYRFGISDVPEVEYFEAKIGGDAAVEKQFAQINPEQMGLSELTYADLSIKRISKEIGIELEMTQEDMVGDLSVIWRGAATQSDTINFAIYKLTNPEAEKPDDSTVKKVLTNIASMSTLVGSGLGSTAMAVSSMAGGNILGIFSQDTKAMNYKYSKVNDADMIILVRKVEDLQQQAVDLYYNYMTARVKLSMMEKMLAERKKNYDLAQNSSREIVLITDAYYRTALDKYMSSRSDFYAKRASLEQFVGNEVFNQFEAEINLREKNNR
ncbi:MAG: hypothetical protein R3Y28_00220 [Candidatus Gastranaerophilales bacterium]